VGLRAGVGLLAEPRQRQRRTGGCGGPEKAPAAGRVRLLLHIDLQLLSVFAENPLDLRDVRGLRQRQLQQQPRA
jgi:hypothetical protein